MPRPHDKLIANAAKAALAPLGFQRKGRSRLWFADHRWWLVVVEFQPSSWSKGSYLNVAAHWLWADVGTFSFDFGGRLDGYEEYASDEQFAAAAVSLAVRASTEAQRLTKIFSSLSATATVLLTAARTKPSRAPGHPGWMAYNAGVAAGLVGCTDDAMEMFRNVLAGPADPTSALHRAADRMSKVALNPAELDREVVSLIEHQRGALGLSPLDAFPF
jgi:hypothetical protein